MDGSSKREPADVGVLFVHGMGEQPRADTLVQFGEALQKWLERWLPASDTRPTVRITHAELAETTERYPAHAYLHIKTDSIESTWLLAESWWAESFRAPSYADLWRWSFQVVPLAVAEHFVRRFRLAKGLHRETLEWLLAGIAIAMLPLLTVVMITSLVIGVFPIPRLRTAILRLQKILVGSVGDSYALLESSIRDAAMSSCIQRDLRWLKTIAPKSVVVAHSQGAAVAHAALRSPEVRPDLLFTFGSGLRKLLVLGGIRGNNRFIVWRPPLGLFLVATGSWLGYRLIVDPSARVDVFADEAVKSFYHVSKVLGFEVTSWRSLMTIGALVGAGLGVAAGEGSIGKRVMFSAGFAAFALLLVVLVKSIMVTGPPGLMALILVIGGSWLLVRGLSVLVGDTYTKIDKRLELDPPVTWIDRYAASDPVPNGPLTSAPIGFVDSRPVWNLGSAFRDHSSYWQNADQFVTAVAVAIASVASINLTATHEWDDQRLLRAEHRRRWRVGWLGVMRAVAVVVGVLLALRFRQGPWRQLGDLPGPLGVIFHEGMDLIEKTPFLKLLVSDWTKSALVQMLGPASLFVCVWLIYRLFLAAWSWWDHHDTEVLFKRRNYALLPVPFIGMLTVVGVVVAMSIGVTTFFDRELVVLWTRDPGILAMRLDYWKTSLQPPSQGVLGAISFAWGASGVAVMAVILARIQWPLRRRMDSVLSLSYVGLCGYTLLALTITLPVAWFLFDPTSSPQAPRYPVLVSRWEGVGAMVVLTALALLTIVIVSAAIDSPIGRKLIERLHHYSAAGPIGSWLVRPEIRSSAVADGLLARRAEQMIAEWNALLPKQRTFSVIGEYNQEAVSLVTALAGGVIIDRDRLLAITDAFPYAALAAANEPGDSDFARRVLEPHKHTSRRAVQRQILAIEKRLGESKVEAQPV